MTFKKIDIILWGFVIIYAFILYPLGEKSFLKTYSLSFIYIKSLSIFLTGILLILAAKAFIAKKLAPNLFKIIYVILWIIIVILQEIPIKNLGYLLYSITTTLIIALCVYWAIFAKKS